MLQQHSGTAAERGMSVTRTGVQRASRPQLLSPMKVTQRTKMSRAVAGSRSGPVKRAPIASRTHGAGPVRTRAVRGGAGRDGITPLRAAGKRTECARAPPPRAALWRPPRTAEGGAERGGRRAGGGAAPSSSLLPRHAVRRRRRWRDGGPGRRRRGAGAAEPPGQDL